MAHIYILLQPTGGFWWPHHFSDVDDDSLFHIQNFLTCSEMEKKLLYRLKSKCHDNKYI